MGKGTRENRQSAEKNSCLKKELFWNIVQRKDKMVVTNYTIG